MAPYSFVFIILVAMGVFILANAVRILNEYERGVIFRLGRVIGVKGPGLILLIPIVDRMVKVSLRTVVMDVRPQDVSTKVTVSIKANAVVYFRVMDPQRAIVEVENYLFATSQLSQTTLRSILGQSELDELLASFLSVAGLLPPGADPGRRAGSRPRARSRVVDRPLPAPGGR